MPSESGYRLIFLKTLLKAFTAFGLGPNADSLADNFIFAAFCLNKLKPATYLSALIFLV